MKGLLHLVPRAEATGDFDEGLREIASELSRHANARGLRVTPMIRLAQDPFGAATPDRGTIEVAGSGSGHAELDSLASIFASSLANIANIADTERSSLLLGDDVVFIASDRAPIRYQYKMRRNEHFDHESYLKRYREVHSRFGIETPGILGYTQFHVDLEASRRAADRAGIGIWDVDSVSELHLASLEDFLSEISRSKIGAEAVADEKVFVDRANSHDFCSRVEWSPHTP